MAFEALDEFLSTAQTVDWKVGVDGPLIVAKGTFSEGLLTRLEDEGLFLTAAGAGPGETQVKVTRDRRSFVAEKFDDFLTAGCEGLVKPDQFRIITGRGPELDENLSFLDECLAFKAALDLLADHSESGAWIFLQIRKLVVRRTISAQDFGLAKGKREVLKRAVSFLADASSEHARSEIFRGALISEFKAGRGGPVTTFGDVIARIDDVCERAETDFALYVHEHGFERLKDEVLARKLATGEKIDKVVSTMEAIGLTIPPAVYAAAKEVNRGAGLGLHQFPSTTNAVLFGAALLFGFLMLCAFLRQRALIADLKRDCDTAEESFKERAGESDENKKRIAEIYKPLTSRLQWSLVFSWIRLVLSFLPLAVTIALGISDAEQEFVSGFWGDVLVWLNSHWAKWTGP